MTLTPAQQVARKGRLTASRIAVLMNGDTEGVLNLYLEMTGQKPEEDLSEFWPARLGEATEQLNLDWYEMKSGQPITKRGHVVLHRTLDWAACTLDGWDCILKCPVECKHAGGREPFETIIDRYQPQGQWQCEVTAASQFALSVIQGANEPRVEYIPRDVDYAAEMVRRGAQFMDCVRNRIPPVALAPAEPPCDPTKIVDMTGNNEWASHADDWLKTREAADLNEASKDALKALVPGEAKKAHGYGVSITRNKAGHLSLREAK